MLDLIYGVKLIKKNTLLDLLVVKSGKMRKEGPIVFAVFFLNM